MLAWLYDMLVGCFCTYEIIKSGPITNGRDGKKIGDYYNVRCTKCGRMKIYNLL